MAIAVLTSAAPADNGLKHVKPESVGMDASRLALIDSVINAALEQGAAPGAVVAVVKDDKVVFEKAYGYRQLVPSREVMTVGTQFDLASLSKCVGTTISIMQLIEQGKLRLTDEVKMYLPDFAPWEDVDITIRDLMTHTSGIDSYINVNNYVKSNPEGDPKALIDYICTKSKRHFRPGTDYIYSCLNFITLQNVLEKITGQRLCDYARRNVFEALGMNSTSYFPIGTEFTAEQLSNIAPTEVQEDGMPLRGQVHDPIARRLNLGNSGNAGVFSNVHDLEIMAAAIMNGGAVGGRRILSPLTVKTMATVPEENNPEVGRALGWDCRSGSAGLRGDLFSREHTLCHTGYTGTSMIMDLDAKVAVIILTNRVHPEDKGGLGRTRATVANIVASSCNSLQ